MTKKTIASTNEIITTNGLEKVRRDGKIAVVYSPGYGAGWFSWNTSHPELLFHPDIVLPLLDESLSQDEREDKAKAAAKLLFPDAYISGQRLRVEWVCEGDQVLIEEYDGTESVRLRSDGEGWVTV